MDSDEDYELDLDSVAIVKKDHVIESERNKANSPFSSENGDDYNSPPVSLIHAMDIPSVRRPRVSVMVQADRVSAHDLPLAETLSAVEGGLFHIITPLTALLVSVITSFMNHYNPTGSTIYYFGDVFLKLFIVIFDYPKKSNIEGSIGGLTQLPLITIQ